MTLWFDRARKRWRYDFIVNKVRHAGFAMDPVKNIPAQSKQEAKLIVDGLQFTAKKAAKGEKPKPGVFTIGMALNEVADRKQGKSDWPKYQKYIGEILEFYGPATPINEITTARIQDYIDWSLKKTVEVYNGGPVKQEKGDKKTKAGTRLRSPSTVKHYLNALHKAFGVANALIDPVTGNPYLWRIPTFPPIKIIKRLARPPEDDLLAKMMAAAPAHLRDAIALSILMGFRKAEVFGELTVDQIDIERRGVWLKGEKTKGKRDEFVPANQAAMQILMRLIDQANKAGEKNLILYLPAKTKDGKQPPPRPIKDARRAWDTLRKKFGIKGRHRFHDLKAAYVTALAMNAAPRVVQELARHKSMATTQNYIRIADAAQRTAVEAIGIGRPILGLVTNKNAKKSQTKSPKQVAANR